MIFNRDVLRVGDDYHQWSDAEIQAHFLPQMRQTAMSAAHKEQQEAKQLKKQAAAALEKEKVAGMTPEQAKAYKKSKKIEALMKDELKLL